MGNAPQSSEPAVVKCSFCNDSHEDRRLWRCSMCGFCCCTTMVFHGDDSMPAVHAIDYDFPVELDVYGRVLSTNACGPVVVIGTLGI